METTQNKLFTPEELMSKLTIAAAEAYEVGAEQDSDELLQFTNAICGIGRAWDAHTAADDALDELDTWMKKVDEVSGAMKNGKLDIFAEKAVLAAGPNESGLSMMETLRATAERLGEDKDRENIGQLIAYIEDFWSALC